MMHKSRTWLVVNVLGNTTAERVACLTEKLTEHTWTNCSGWRLDGYLFLNDQTSENGAFEVAILAEHVPGLPQVESITFSWCTPEKAREYIQRAISGGYDDQYWDSGITARQLENREQHRARFCSACA